MVAAEAHPNRVKLLIFASLMMTIRSLGLIGRFLKRLPVALNTAFAISGNYFDDQ